MHFHKWVKIKSYFDQRLYECSECGERKTTESDMFGWSSYDISHEWNNNRFNEFFKYNITLQTVGDFQTTFNYFILNGNLYEDKGNQSIDIYFNEKVKWYNFFKKKQIKKCIEFIEKNKPVTINVNYAIAKNIEIKNNIGM